jgi:hypothetical protein
VDAFVGAVDHLDRGALFVARDDFDRGVIVHFPGEHALANSAENPGGAALGFHRLNLVKLLFVAVHIDRRLAAVGDQLVTASSQ